MASEQGYSNQKKKGKAQFKTIHSSGSDSYAEQVIPKYLSDIVVPTVFSAISTITDIVGSNGQVEFWEIAFIDPHYAIKGDVFRLKATSDELFNFEFEIVSVIDANTIRVLPISEVKPSSGDNGILKRWVTANSDAEGNPQIVLTPAPTKFLLDGIITDVSKDTVNPSASIPLPVEDVKVYDLLTDFSNIIGNVDNAPGSAGAGVPSLVFDPALGEFKYALVDASGNLKISAASLPLPSGAATEAKQDTGNTSLSNLDAKIAGSLAPVAHDEVGLTYVGTTTDIATVTYKLAGTPVATLTLTYDGSNRLVGVVRS